MSLLTRFWDREPSSLSTHVLTQFYTNLCFHFICESYINVSMYLCMCGTGRMCSCYFYNVTFWGSKTIIL